jgi:hypothetical protein
VRAQGAAATKLITAPGDHADAFCGGSQINIQKNVVFGATLSNGHNAIIVAGSGDLTGPVRTIAEEGAEFTSLACSPSIDADGRVAFMGIRNGRRGIFTIGPPPQSTVTVMVDDNGPFVGFTDVALNRTGGLAFGARLPGGARVIERIKSNAMTKVGDTTPGGGALSINDSGDVAYEVGSGVTSVYRGPASLFGRIVGPGTVVLGRTVASAAIDRDSFNSVGQVAVLLTFFDGTQMVARAEPVHEVIAVPVGALQLTADGGSVGTGTSLPTPVRGLLTFDVSFLSSQGTLTPKVDGVALKPIPASQPGVRQHISIPFDARPPGKVKRPLSRMGELRFALDGKPGASVQISNVSIPGLFEDRIDADALSRWRADTSRGGSVEVVSITRLPVKIRLTPAGKPPAAKTDVELVRAAVLSTEDLDATNDLDRNTLRLGGFPVRSERDNSGKQQPVCEESDVDGDKRKDLVCEVEVKGLAKPEKDKKTELRLEAMTRFGWGIGGADVLAAAPAK